MKLMEMVAEHLKRIGADGLCCEPMGCGCLLEDLAPCCEPSEECEAARKINKPTKPCNCCSEGSLCDWHMTKFKDESADENQNKD